jgi:hypothetical protein
MVIKGNEIRLGPADTMQDRNQNQPTDRTPKLRHKQLSHRYSLMKWAALEPAAPDTQPLHGIRSCLLEAPPVNQKSGKKQSRMGVFHTSSIPLNGVLVPR